MSKLAKACELSLNEWLGPIPDELPKVEYSKKHERWKKNLFNKMRGGYYHRFTTQTIKVMMVAAILMALLMTAFIFPSSRETTLDNLNAFSIFKITQHNKNSVNREIKVGYIPEGFGLECKDSTAKVVQSDYISNNGQYFTIFKSSSSMKMEFNTEFFDSEEIIVNNIKYTYCQGNEGVNNLVWTRNDYVYRMDGTLIKEEMLKIAKTVE